MRPNFQTQLISVLWTILIFCTPNMGWSQSTDRIDGALWRLKSKTGGSKCTGVFVSPKGYFLTNLHCITQCLEDNDLLVTSDPDTKYEPLRPYKESAFHKLYLTLQVDREILCEDLIISHPSLKKLYGKPSLLAWGRGWGTLSTKNIDQLSESDFLEWTNSVEDYALLQFYPREDETFSCLPLVPVGEISEDYQVETLGYPSGKIHSGGLTLFRYSGSLRSPGSLSPYLKSLPLSPLAINRHRYINSHPKLLVSSAAVFPGMSGGVLINSKKEIIGLNYSTNKSASEESLEKGSSFSFGAEFLIESLQTNWSLAQDKIKCND